ncbi:beta-galactosidase [Halorubrum trapanicum]|uniref:beta-galactosidase n=1 Tax=Halorubrum trapanicum TaxID=29284 RepID=A0A8J7R909_9EURY|nr:glycoside hydrolase family 2 TIM barrel-domain containing protein [Halorubrum trapanicum]MBP1902871.1 beta-galactosidase [Halorubrum trapanicum]
MSREPAQLAGLDDYIENPARIEEGVEPTHVPSVSYESTASARDAAARLTEPETRWASSKYFRLLNGDWSFAWAEKPSDLPDRLGGDIEWDEISVPGVWQLSGYDRPIYRNIALTWEQIPEVESMPEPPRVPETFNPVGTYQRNIEVPAEWDGDRHTFLHFEGVKSAFFVWVDGEYVGYDQGSMTPSEFDLTEILDPGESHTLTVQVFRFSDGSYLETQDMVRFSGIFRSVYVYSKPSVFLRDYDVQTELHPSGDATLTVDAEVVGGDTDGWRVIGRMFDGETELATAEATLGAEEGDASIRTTVPSPTPWSAEQPALYDLVLEIRNPDGSVVEVVPDRVGFREFTIEDGQVLINGDPITVRGINRHEHDPETGRTVSFERVREELTLLKQHNVNAIRTAHYPNDLAVYELADELGFYVIDEANIETHFNMNFVNERPAFETSFLRRFEQMVDHHKNFASIFAWSTSNEAGQGVPHEKMASYAREGDPTRFVYHQGSGDAPYEEFHESMTGTAPFADISGPRYAVPHTLAQHSAVEDRPLIMGEYGHALCNSLGLQDAFWDLVNAIDGLQGGFIWEWTNQTLAGHVVSDAAPGEWWFDDDPFLLDGTAFSDLTLQPELRQVKKTHQPFAFDDVALAEGVFTVSNYYSSTNLSAYETTWELTVDGEQIQSGVLELDVVPGQTRGVTVPFDLSEIPSDRECHLTFRVRLSEETDWAPAGHEIGFDQFSIPVPPTETTEFAADGAQVSPGEQIALEETDDVIVLSGDRFRYRFDTGRGRFDELQFDGETVASDGPVFGAFRAPIANEGHMDSDTEWGYDNEGEWRSLGLHALSQVATDHIVERDDESGVRITCSTELRPPERDALFEVDFAYEVSRDGTVDASVDARPTPALTEELSTWLPRLGIELELSSSMTDVEWFGRGPHETYPDRKTGCEVGRYEGRIDDQFVPYRLPSDNGNKTDVRWASTTGSQTGLTIAGETPLNVRFDTYENLADAKRIQELVPAERTTMFVDIAVAGVGGTPVKPLREHRISAEPVSVSFTIRPHEAEADPASIVRGSDR